MPFTSYRFACKQCTDIAPLIFLAGFVVVFTVMRHRRHLVEDHLGKTVYDVASGTLFISNSVRYPEMSLVIPAGSFKKWNGTSWIKDTEEGNLVAGSCPKMYRVLLNRVDTSTAPDIEWPVNLSESNHWDYAAARRAQERAASGCYFS